ncbi:MAG: FG-GAP repeat domain-containing protein [Acidobacteriaceae bacterium]
MNILLGNGDGTFTTAPSPAATGNVPSSIAVGDFNGDKKLDLAVVNYGDNTVTILLGNGDGTFAEATGSPVSVGGGADSIVAADFNGDGKLDLAVTNSTDNTLSILLGNGDGTFTPTPSRPVTGVTPFGLAVGDFNGDGKLDLAVANFNDNATILLGNGDGTFTPAPAQPTTAQGFAIVTGDFNGDGKLDLATSNYGDSTVAVLLGNGDGTFTPIGNCCGDSVELTHTLGMTIGDFNGDGRPDLALAIMPVEVGNPSTYAVILLGNADGTFTPTDFSLPLPPDLLYLAPGDFNGDGKLDFAAATTPYSYLSVLLQPPAALPAPDFAIAPPAAPLVVQAGNTGTSSVQLTSLNGFTGPVSLSCSGAPVDATCSVPSSVFLFNTIDTPSVTIATTVRSNAMAAAGFMAPPQDRWPLGL